MQEKCQYSFDKRSLCKMVHTMVKAIIRQFTIFLPKLDHGESVELLCSTAEIHSIKIVA